MKSLIVIFVILIIGIAFIAVWDFSSSKIIDETDYNQTAWRLPVIQEIENVNKSFLKSSIAICDVYFIKKFAGEKFLIACEEIDGLWTYYTVYARQERAYRASRDLAAGFIPPHLRLEEERDNIVKLPPSPKKTNNIPTVNKSSVETK